VRVLDTAFRKELGQFLLGAKDSISFTPKDFSPIADVRQLLHPALEPGFVQQSRLAAIVSGLEPQIPGVRLAVAQDRDGSWTLITADNLFSLFVGGQDGPQAARYLTAFGSPTRMPGRLRELDVEPRLIESLDGLPAGLMIVGTTEHENAQWTAVDDVGAENCFLSSVNRPGSGGGSEATGEWFSASTEEVPERAA
jgi:hypothetical protein